MTRILKIFPAFICCVLPLPACSRVDLHADFPSLAPKRVAVLPVADESSCDLSDVTFDGLIQRVLPGRHRVDVRESLRRALERALEGRGYELARPPASGDASGGGVDGGAAPGSGAATPDCDGVLRATILSWSSSYGAGLNLSMAYRVELYRVPSGVLLYAGDFLCRHGPRASDREFRGLDALFLRSARDALRALPASALNGLRGDATVDARCEGSVAVRASHGPRRHQRPARRLRFFDDED